MMTIGGAVALAKTKQQLAEHASVLGALENVNIAQTKTNLILLIEKFDAQKAENSEADFLSDCFSFGEGDHGDLIMAGVEYNAVDEIKELIDRGVNVPLIINPANKKSSMLVAAEHQAYETLDVLLNYKSEEWTPAYQAQIYGILCALDMNNRSVIHFMVMNGCQNMVLFRRIFVIANEQGGAAEYRIIGDPLGDFFLCGYASRLATERKNVVFDILSEAADDIEPYFTRLNVYGETGLFFAAANFDWAVFDTCIESYIERHRNTPLRSYSNRTLLMYLLRGIGSYEGLIERIQHLVESLPEEVNEVCAGEGNVFQQIVRLINEHSTTKLVVNRLANVFVTIINASSGQADVSIVKKAIKQINARAVREEIENRITLNLAAAKQAYTATAANQGRRKKAQKKRHGAKRMAVKNRNVRTPDVVKAAKAIIHSLIQEYTAADDDGKASVFVKAIDCSEGGIGRAILTIVANDLQDEVKSLIDLGLDLKQLRNPETRDTVFNVACVNASLEMVQLLAESYQAQGDEFIRWISVEHIPGVTKLHIVCSEGRTEIAEYLLSIHDEDVQRDESHLGLPIHVAASKSHWNIVRLILDHELAKHPDGSSARALILAKAPNNLPITMFAVASTSIDIPLVQKIIEISNMSLKEDEHNRTLEEIIQQLFQPNILLDKPTRVMDIFGGMKEVLFQPINADGVTAMHLAANRWHEVLLDAVWEDYCQYRIEHREPQPGIEPTA